MKKVLINRHGVYYVKIGRRALITWIANSVHAFSARIFGKGLHFPIGDKFLLFSMWSLYSFTISLSCQVLSILDMSLKINLSL